MRKAWRYTRWPTWSTGRFRYRPLLWRTEHSSKQRRLKALVRQSARKSLLTGENAVAQAFLPVLFLDPQTNWRIPRVQAAANTEHHRPSPDTSQETSQPASQDRWSWSGKS